MQRLTMCVVLTTLCVTPAAAFGQSLWARREPGAYLFADVRAKTVGDLVTIVVDETTEFAGQDKKELNKQTNTSAAINMAGSYSAGQQLTRSLSGQINGAANSQRQFEGTSNNVIDRKLADHMTAVVIDVFPNGNLLIEGRRHSTISKEVRTLMVKGIIRPQDIGPYNMILSQYIADMTLIYEGHGPESSYTNHGNLGKLMNWFWPF